MALVGTRDLTGVHWLVMSQGGEWTAPSDFLRFADEEELRQVLSRLLDIVESLGMKWFRHEIDAPATVFLTTDYVENRRLFWWDRFSWNERGPSTHAALTRPGLVRGDIRPGLFGARAPAERVGGR